MVTDLAEEKSGRKEAKKDRVTPIVEWAILWIEKYVEAMRAKLTPWQRHR